MNDKEKAAVGIGVIAAAGLVLFMVARAQAKKTATTTAPPSTQTGEISLQASVSTDVVDQPITLTATATGNISTVYFFALTPSGSWAEIGSAPVVNGTAVISFTPDMEGTWEFEASSVEVPPS